MVDEKSIEPHVPEWDKAERMDVTLRRSDFAIKREAPWQVHGQLQR
jgi:hypothetical protein